jgi:hypothetical protein
MVFEMTFKDIVKYKDWNYGLMLCLNFITWEQCSKMKYMDVD